MISVNDFKTGMTIEYDGNLYQVIEFQHVKPGKGAAFVRSKLRNLRAGSVQDITFRAGEKVQRAHVEKRSMQYSYSVGDDYTFMDLETYDQLSIPKDRLTRELKFLKEGMDVSILMFGNEILGIHLPTTVELKVIQAEPGIKGDTASGGDKLVTLETGLELRVPLFINEDEVLVVNTDKTEYVSRV